jgi:hypothetical protein
MPILRIRLTNDEERVLARRARNAGVTRAAYVRQLIRGEPFGTAADVLADAASPDAWLGQVRKRKRAARSSVSANQILEHRNADRR